MSTGRWWSVDGGWGWLEGGAAAGAAEIALAALLGLCLGSFLNVVIHRLPRDQSVWWPASRCPRCERRLPPWENVPLVSWLALGGRCRGCAVAIPWRYPAVEAVSAVVTALAVALLGLTPAAAWVSVFVLALVAVAWIDAEHRVIPDELSLGLAAVGLFVRGAHWEGVLTALAGALFGFAALALVAWGFRRVRGVDGLGGGDVKLAAGLGAFLGPPGLVLTVVLAAAAGSLAGIALIAAGRTGRGTALPFGSILAPAAVLVLVAGPALWAGYLRLAGFANS